ncbi:MAG: DNA polymerase III subunit epsilon [Gammaproteobacteria bacterium]|nr:DNA polymerase III subunit epsilon [Gammaproteobacteria bacterium]
MRQIILDTETTGLEVEQGHRIIEIGCIELINRRHTGNHYHQYINPQRDVDAAAVKVHGLTAAFLSEQPVFAAIAKEFLDFVRGAELVIHNAEFDIGFLDYELALQQKELGRMSDYCQVLDTLQLARHIHPGQRNSLDALCKRYGVSIADRDLHGALLDSRLLSEAYLAMTGGQAMLTLNDEDGGEGQTAAVSRIDRSGLELTVIGCSAEELRAHEARLAGLDKVAEKGSVWRRLESVD